MSQSSEGSWTHFIFVRHRWAIWFGVLVLLGLIGAALWQFTSLSEYLRPSRISQDLNFLTKGPLGVVWTLAAFVVACFFVVPINLVFLIVGTLFEFWWAVFLNLAGAQLAAFSLYFVGTLLDMDKLLEYAPPRIKGLQDKSFKNMGVLELSILRFLPLGPFTTMNLFLGAVRVPPLNFFFASIIGLVPGAVFLSLVGAGIRTGAESSGKDSLLWISLGMLGFLSLSLLGRKVLSRRSESE